MPDRFGRPVVTMLVCFLFLHTRLWVRMTRPAFPAPSDLREGADNCITRARLRRGKVELWVLGDQTRCRPGQVSAANAIRGPYLDYLGDPVFATRKPVA